MAKRTLGYVQLEWVCPNCGAKNPGLEKLCRGCGAAQPDNVEFQQAAQEEFVTDQVEIARAEAGADVHCKYCGTRNLAEAETCIRCGADLGEATARESGRVLGAHRAEFASPISCPACGSLNDPGAHACSQCGASMVAAAEPEPVRPASASKGISSIVLVGIGLLVVAAVVVFAILAGRTEDVVGRVQAVEWTRTIAVEALRPVTYEGWYDEIPEEGEILSCTDKVHHTQSDPVPDSIEVCGTPYTVDKGTGVGEVVQDCEYEVYADWCDYNLDEWQEIDSVILAGDDLFPAWPDVALAADEREGQRSEAYKVFFVADDENHTYHPDDAAEFARCKVGSEWVLEVNTFGQVRSITLAD